jgi:hypothetical protein
LPTSAENGGMLFSGHHVVWDLRILCESGAPIESILASWPTLPLVAKFNAVRKSKTFPGTSWLALRRPDRLCEIDLHVTSSMLASIVEVTQKPCQALESIRITVEALTGPSILVRNAFLGGSAPHLREIKLDGIAFPFPSIQQVLLSTNNLVELHLGHIPNDAYFSPNDLVTGLSTLLQLKRLTVDFHSPASFSTLKYDTSTSRRTLSPPSCLLIFTAKRISRGVCGWNRVTCSLQNRHKALQRHLFEFRSSASSFFV